MLKWVIFSILCLYAFLDSYHTWWWLHLGLAQEANPIMNWFINKTNLSVGLFASKGLFLLLTGVVVHKSL